MTTAEMKASIHQRIDEIEDEEILEAYLQMMNIDNYYGSLWKQMTEEEQNEIIRIAEDAKLPGNTIPHEEVMAKYAKWL